MTKFLIESKLHVVHARLTELFSNLEDCKEFYLREQIERNIQPLLEQHTKFSEQLNAIAIARTSPGVHLSR